MRYVDFKLYEYDRSKTIEKLGTALTSRAERDNTDTETVLSNAEAADPTSNKQYVVWILRQYIKHNLPLNQFDNLSNSLNVFYTTKGQHKRIGITSDINQYNWQTLIDTVKKISSTDVSDNSNKDIGVPDAKVLYNGPLGLLVVPETEAASCELGRGTKWCTAATKSENRFEQYNRQGPLYIWIDQKSKKKFQFHFETFQFMNDLDIPLDKKQLTYFAKENPITKKLFSSKKSAIENTAEDYFNYIESKEEYEEDPDHYEDEYGPFEENPDWDDLETSGLYIVLGEENLTKYLNIIKKSTNLAYDYATTIVQGRWKPAEKIILSEILGFLVVDYAKNIIKGRWPEAESKLLRSFYSNSHTVAKYAGEILNGNWPEAERIGINYPEFVVNYSFYRKSRWAEAEKTLATDHLKYPKYHLKRYLKMFDITVDDLEIDNDLKEKLKQKM